MTFQILIFLSQVLRQFLQIYINMDMVLKAHQQSYIEKMSY